MNRQELNAYAAGFMDGEGCICIGKTNKKDNANTLALRIDIGQTDPRPLMLLRENWGGSIYLNKQRFSMWRLQSKMAEKFLNDVYPYLIVKKDQAQIALEFRKLYGKHKGGRYIIGVTKEILESRIKLKNELDSHKQNTGFAYKEIQR